MDIEELERKHAYMNLLEDFQDLPDKMQAAMEAVKKQLRSAARGGRLEEVRQAVKRGADVHSANDGGVTALHHAGQFGHEEVAAFLIGEGADLNARTKKLWTPLMWAAVNGHARLVKLLLEAGADPALKNKWGDTARDGARMQNRLAAIAELDAWEVRA